MAVTWRPADWPLRVKMAVLLTMASLVPLVVTTATDIHEGRRQLLANAASLLGARSRNLADAIDAFHHDYQRAIGQLAGLPTIVQFAGVQRGNRTALQSSVVKTLHATLGGDPNVDNVSLLDLHGVVLESSDGATLGDDLSRDVAVRDALAGGSLVSDLYLPRGDSTRTAVAYSAPILDGHNIRVGTAVVWVQARALWKVIREGDALAGPGSFAVLFDSLGIRIGHTYSAEILFHPGGVLPAATRDALVADHRFGIATSSLLDDVRSFPEQFQRARARVPDSSMFLGFAPVNSRWSYGVGRRLASVPWTIFYMIPEALLTSQITRMARQKAIVAALLILLAMVVGVIFAAGILRPVEAIASAAQRIAGGDLDARVALQSGDELGRLGATFNAMAAKVNDQRVGLESARGESERRYRALFECAPDGIVIANAAGDYIDANATMCRMVGYERDAFIGMSARQLIAPDDHGDLDAVSRAVRGGIDSRREWLMRRHDGSTFPADVVATQMPDGNVMALVRDASDRKQIERRFNKRNTVSRILADAHSLAAATPEIIRAICDAEGWDFGAIWEVDAVSGVLQCRETWHRATSNCIALATQTSGMKLVRGEGLPGRVWQAGVLEFIPDIASGPTYLRRAEANACGVRSAIAVPIFVGDTVTGVMDFAAREMRPPDQPVREMFVAIGKQVGGFVERQRAEEALRESEARLTFALHTSEIGAWQMSLVDHRASRSLLHAKIFGYTSVQPSWNYEVFLGHVVPEDRAAVDASFRAATTARANWSVECRIKRLDGETRWIQVNGGHEHDDSGVSIRVSGIVQDITERKHATEVMRESEKYFRFLNDFVEATRMLAAPDQIMAVAAEMLGVHLGASRCAYADVESDGDDFTIRHDYTVGCATTVGRYQLSLFGPRAVATLHAGHTLVVRDVKAELEAHEGGEMFGAIGIQAIITCPLVKDGVLRAMMAVHQDVPRDWTAGEIALVEDVADRCWSTIERRAAEADVHKLNAELERRVAERTGQLNDANKELEAFSYSVSHDLRAPLRAVDGYSQAVLEDFGPMLPADGQRQLRTIRQSAQRMGTLIDDLLTFARLNRQFSNRQSIDTTVLVHEILLELGAPWSDRNLEIRVAQLPPSVADRALLKQVWINLLGNAIKYTAKKEQAIVEVGASVINGVSAFTVRDNGAGFDMRYAAKLFGVFQRLHSEDEFEGTGVGLAIVQRVVHRHGGRVWAEASVNDGATFFFTLEPDRASD